MHQASVAVLSFAGRYSFGNNTAFGIPADMEHFGTGIGDLFTLGHCNRIEFPG
jgi:hypothetical protein